MSWTSKKAEPADKPNTEAATSEKPQFSEAQSNQEQFTGTGGRTIGMSESHEPGMTYMSKVRETGNQVKLGPNTKGTSTLKDPLNSYRQTIMSADQNPDGRDNRTSTPFDGNKAKRS